MATVKSTTGPPSRGPRKKGDNPNGRSGPRAGSLPVEEGGGTKRIEYRKVGLLKPHPRQGALFRPLPEPELERLAESLRRRGQDEPVEVTTDDVLISGHNRVEAARRNGWAEVRVWVRDDLPDAAAVELRLIQANRDRRQLDMLDMVRLARRELEIEQGRKPGGLSQCAEQGLCERVGRMVGRSPRHVQRLVNVLNAPLEVQAAYSAGKVNVQHAEKVSRLGEAEREEIAEEIRAGGDPAAVVVAHLPESGPAEVDPDKEYRLLLKHATHAVTALEGREDEVIGGLDLDAEVTTLERVIGMSKKLVARNRALGKLREKTLREISGLRNLK